MHTLQVKLIKEHEKKIEDLTNKTIGELVAAGKEMVDIKFTIGFAGIHYVLITFKDAGAK